MSTPLTPEEEMAEFEAGMNEGHHFDNRGKRIHEIEQQTAALREELETEKAAFRLAFGMLKAKKEELEAVKKERDEARQIAEQLAKANSSCYLSIKSLETDGDQVVDLLKRIQSLESVICFCVHQESVGEAEAISSAMYEVATLLTSLENKKNNNIPQHGLLHRFTEENCPKHIYNQMGVCDNCGMGGSFGF